MAGDVERKWQELSDFLGEQIRKLNRLAEAACQSEGGAVQGSGAGDPGPGADAGVSAPPTHPGLREVAGDLMQHFNEAVDECPICGVGDGDHEADALCAALDRALATPPAASPEAEALARAVEGARVSTADILDAIAAYRARFPKQEEPRP